MFLYMPSFVKWFAIICFGLITAIFLWAKPESRPAPMEVFKRVFLTLPDSVTVYPTENYYYFKLPTDGKIIQGNLRLDARDRDQGVIHLGYFEVVDGKPVTLGARIFGVGDGVEVKKIDAWNYDVTALGRTVSFALNDIGFTPPRAVDMAESGIRRSYLR